MRATQFAPIPPRDGLHAAALWVDLTPCLGVRMGGFGFQRGYPTRRLLGRLGATVLLLDDGKGHRFLMIAADLHAGLRYVTERVAEALAPWLGVQVKDVWMVASHCHSGPGNIYAESLYDLMASRSRGFDVATVEDMVERLVDTARRLPELLVPAQIGGASHVLWKVFWNRSVLATLANRGRTAPVPPEELVRNPLRAVDKAYGRTFASHLAGVEAPPDEIFPLHDIRAISEHLGRFTVDPRVQVIFVSQRNVQQTPLCTIGLIHATPTIFGPTARCLTGDVTAYASSMVRRHMLVCDYPVTIVAGAMADANVTDPAMSISEFRKLRKNPDVTQVTHSLARTAQRLSAAVIEAQFEARARSQSDIVITTKMSESLICGATLKNGEKLPTEIAIGKSTMAGSELLRDEPKDFDSMFEEPSYDRFRGKRQIVRTAGNDPHSPKRGGWFVELLASGVGAREATRVMTPFLSVRSAKLGEIQLLGLPVEPSLGLSLQLKQDLGPLLPSDPNKFYLFGLTSGYLGYATTRLEYCVQDYEGASTYWGRQFGEFIVEQSAALLERPHSAPLAKVAEFATRDLVQGPMVDLSVKQKSDVAPASLTPGFTREDAYFGGVWFSALPTTTTAHRPIHSYPVIVRLTKNGRPWTHDGMEVNDRNYCFLLRRRLSHDEKNVVWSFHVRRAELPLYEISDAIHFEVMAQGQFLPLSRA